MITDKQTGLLRQKLQDILGMSGYDFSLSEPLADRGLDSLRSVQLIVELEELFDVTFDDDELLFENFATLDRISQMLGRKMTGIA